MNVSDDQQSQRLKRSTEDLRTIVIKKKELKEKYDDKSELQNLNNDEDDGVNKLWKYEEILKILGFGKTQWTLIIIGALLIMNATAAVYSLSIIGIASQCEFNITQKEKGVMMAACIAGLALSTYIWGFLSDIWGRRSVLISSMCLTNLLQFCLMFVTNFWFYNVINFIMGISLGGVLGPIYLYVSEFNMSEYRTIVINYCNMFVSVTTIYVPAISWLVLSFNWSYQITTTFIFNPWRLIMLFSMLPGLIGTLLLFYFPESPKLLLSHGKHKQALEALYFISRYNIGKDLKTILNTSTIQLKSEEFADIDLNTIRPGFSILSGIWKATLPLFHKPHGKQLIMSLITLQCMLLWAASLQMWFPEMVNRLAASDLQMPNTSFTLCEVISKSYQQNHDNTTNKLLCDDTVSTTTFINNIVMGFVIVIGFIMQGLFLKFLGRKIVLFSCLFVGVLSGLLLHFVTNTMGIMILLCLCILLLALIGTNVISVIVDLLPTHLNGKAICLGLTLVRIGTIIATNLIAAMLTSHCSGIFILMTTTILACGVIAYFLPI